MDYSNEFTILLATILLDKGVFFIQISISVIGIHLSKYVGLSAIMNAICHCDVVRSFVTFPQIQCYHLLGTFCNTERYSTYMKPVGGLHTAQTVPVLDSPIWDLG